MNTWGWKEHESTAETHLTVGEFAKDGLDLLGLGQCLIGQGFELLLSVMIAGPARRLCGNGMGRQTTFCRVVLCGRQSVVVGECGRTFVGQTSGTNEWRRRGRTIRFHFDFDFTLVPNLGARNGQRTGEVRGFDERRIQVGDGRGLKRVAGGRCGSCEEKKKKRNVKSSSLSSLDGFGAYLGVYLQRNHLGAVVLSLFNFIYKC